MPLRIFIIILLLWTGVPAFAEAARLTLGVAPGAVRDAGLENQASQLAAELTKSLGDEVSVRRFDNPLQLGQWLNPYAMIELGLVDAAFLKVHPGKFLVLGYADQTGRWLVITRQGAPGDFSQRVAASLNYSAITPALDKSSVASSPPPATGKSLAQSARSSEPALVKSPVASEPTPAAGARPPQPVVATASTPLTLGLMVTRDGLIRTPDQAKRFTAQLGRWLGVSVRARVFESKQTLADWFNRYQALDLALVDEFGRQDPLAGNYRPLQRLVTAGGGSALLVARRELPEARVAGALRALAVYGHDPSLEEILADAPVKSSSTPEVKSSAVPTAAAARSSAIAAPPAVVASRAPVMMALPVLPRLPEAPIMPPAPAKPAMAQPEPTAPPAPVAVAEPPAPVAVAEAPAPVAVAVTEAPAPVAVAEPPAPVAVAEPPVPVVVAEAPVPVVVAEAPAPVAVAEPPAPVVVAEAPTPVTVVELSTETVAAVPEAVPAATPTGEAAPAGLAGASDVPAVIAQPDLPQELRPPGVPQPRPGRLPEAAPPAEEPTIFGKLQDLIGRTPKPAPLLPPPDPEPGVVYVVPFITLMVPAEVRERAFDQFVDLLNQRGVEQGLKFVILKQGLDKIDRTWLNERKYVLGEIYGYVEDSGCCSTDLRTRARVTFYRAHLPDPALKYEYPVRMFFDHDQSILSMERQKLADQIALTLAEELLKALQP